MTTAEKVAIVRKRLGLPENEATDEEVDLYEDDPWDNFADDWETHA